MAEKDIFLPTAGEPGGAHRHGEPTPYAEMVRGEVARRAEVAKRKAEEEAAERDGKRPGKYDDVPW